jgi:hypothetical protein
MTDETQDQGQDPAADAIDPTDPSVAHDAEETEADSGQADSDPTPDTSADAQTPYGEGGPEGQEGTPGADAPDPAGVEPGETVSVPTTRGPGPEDEGDGGGA